MASENSFNSDIVHVKKEEIPSVPIGTVSRSKVDPEAYTQAPQELLGKPGQRQRSASEAVIQTRFSKGEPEVREKATKGGKPFGKSGSESPGRARDASGTEEQRDAETSEKSHGFWGKCDNGKGKPGAGLLLICGGLTVALLAVAVGVAVALRKK